MDFLVLDENLQTSSVLDVYESILWVDRYNQCGDFELYTSMNDTILNEIKPDYYIWSRDSEHVMIVEDIKINTDSEDGNELIIVGRSLESLLDRRIIWNQTILSGNFQNGVKKLIDENVISPTDTNRKIDNFIFVDSEDEAITSLTVEAQFTGDNLYDAICDLCASKKVGFKVTLTDDLKFAFQLYSGIDRSYNQVTNPYVVFSPAFDNIINSNYLESKKTLKTITLVAGEGEGSDRKTISVAIDEGAGTGLNRRELYTDARDISSTTEDGELSTTEYNSQLEQRGKEKLAENTITKSFEGEMETLTMFKYGEDFFMGDIVQIINEFGIEGRVRVIEMVISQDESGIDSYPTFDIV